MQEKFPPWYRLLRSNYGKFMELLEQLGEAVRQEGPLDSEKTSQLIQLGAAAAVRSEGSVHSHVRRGRVCRGHPGGDLSHPDPPHQHHRLPHDVRGLKLGLDDILEKEPG